MDILNNLINRQNHISFNSIFDFSPLSNDQIKHLKNVYSSLLCGIVITGFGAVFQNKIIPIPPLLSIIMLFVCILSLSGTSTNNRHFFNNDKVADMKRFLYFGGFAFFEGTAIGDFVGFAHRFYPGVLETAFFGSLAIFVCFSGVSIFAKERSYLYLGSILSSILMYMGIASLFNIFFQVRFVTDIILYGGLLLYIGFVVYHTQVTIEDYKSGNRDYLLHGVVLYLDFLAIFVRICFILMDKEEKKKSQRKRG